MNGVAFRPPASGPSIEMSSGAFGIIAFCDANGAPVITINADGTTYWRAKLVASDTDFRAAMSELSVVMAALVTGSKPPAPRSRLYARYWPYAPDWATHLATDSSGLVCAYDREPSFIDGEWLPNGGQCAVVTPSHDPGPAQSCEARPC